VPAAKFCSVTQACRTLNVEPHILRYWERMFEMKPRRNSAGRRIYSAEQVEKLRLIKHLVYTEKLTVKGARRRLAGMSAAASDPTRPKDRRATLLWLKKELVSLEALLSP
jgi:DNA-binding transcriptional MerR regulator